MSNRLNFAQTRARSGRGGGGGAVNLFEASDVRVEAQSAAQIEARGRVEFLGELATELRAGTYRPRPYRRRAIPKEGGKVRVISIPDSVLPADGRVDAVRGRVSRLDHDVLDVPAGDVDATGEEVEVYVGGDGRGDRPTRLHRPRW